MKWQRPSLQLSSSSHWARVVATLADFDTLMQMLSELPLRSYEHTWVYVDTTLCSTDALVKWSQFIAFALQMQHGAWRLNRDVSSCTGKLQELHLDQGAMNDHRFACVFSALPYARSVHTLQLSRSTRQYEPWILSALELNWIAYAIFHPESKTSSWTKLLFYNCELSEESQEVLRSMISAAASHAASKQLTGNALRDFARREVTPSFLSATKLAALMGIRHHKRKRDIDAAHLSQRENEANTIYLARLRENAAVQTDCSDGASPLIVLASETELEICDFQLACWRCVLVPGFGFGWVHQDDILASRELRPSHDFQLASSLTSFELMESFSHDAAVQFISVVKDSLESLCIAPREMSTTILDDVSSLCPSLKSLSLTKMYGEKLSRESVQRFFSQSSTCALRSFTVSWEILHTSALLKILSNAKSYQAVNSLTMLHICNLSDKGFVKYACRIGEMLFSNQVLEQVYLTGCDDKEGIFDWWDGKVVSPERSRRCRLGLLSVLAHDSIKHDLSSDLIALIFGFVQDRRIVQTECPW